MSRPSFDNRFFACGLACGAGQPPWADHLRTLGEDAHVIPYPDRGFAFYTLPPLVDAAQTEDFVCLKMGLAHDGARPLSTQDLIDRGWVSPGSIRSDLIQGSPLIACLSKRSPHAFVYRGLFAAATAFFYPSECGLLITDNLRLMSMYLPHPTLNEAVLPKHFLFRASFDAVTPIQDVTRLSEGELLSWDQDGLKVELVRDLQPFIHPETQQPYQPRHAAESFDALRQVVRLYLDGRTRTTATMLSGGIDLSVLQAAINALPEIDFQFPSFSYTANTPALQIEMENARAASAALGTRHTFVPMSADDYSESLIQSIEVLGQPVSDDVRPSFLYLARRMSEQAPAITQLIHGGTSESFFGVSASDRIAQGDRYRRWPIPLLWLASKLLAPIAPMKAYGAAQAMVELRRRQHIDRLDEKLRTATYTDVVFVQRCFPESALAQAFLDRERKASRYLDTNEWLERENTSQLFDEIMGAGSITRQLGQFYGREYVFPYADDIIAKFTFSIQPATRYTYHHVIRHILIDALVANVPGIDVHRPKGWSSIGQDYLFGMMRAGPLRDLVLSIECPAFVERQDFDLKLAEPDWFTWNLLTLDLFQKHVLRSTGK